MHSALAYCSDWAKAALALEPQRSLKDHTPIDRATGFVLETSVIFCGDCGRQWDTAIEAYRNNEDK